MLKNICAERGETITDENATRIIEQARRIIGQSVHKIQSSDHEVC